MIKFIYFDVGGVVIKDFSKTNKWDDFMNGIGVKKSDYGRFDKFWEGLEVSGMDEMQPIVPLINEEFKLSLPLNHSLLLDFVRRFEKNKSIWPVIDKAKSKHKVGLLTNMYPGMMDLIEKRDLMPDIKWDVVVDSSVEKLLKPQKKIYEFAQRKAGVAADEIMFVENSKSHVEAAKGLGWQTFLYDSRDYDKSSSDLEEII